MAIGAVLFDVDETLYDRVLAQRQVLQRLPAGLPEIFGDVGVEALQAAWQDSDRETTEHKYTVDDIRASRNVRSALFLRLLGLSARHTDAVTRFYVETYPTIAAPIEHAVSTVAACATKLPVGVVSNSYPDVQYSKLETLGVRHLFRCIVLSEEYGGPRKPAADIFLRGCELLDTPPAATLYVGDSFGNDVIGAQGAGLLACWYNPQSLPAPAGSAPPQYELQSLRDLPQLL